MVAIVSHQLNRMTEWVSEMENKLTTTVKFGSSIAIFSTVLLLSCCCPKLEALGDILQSPNADHGSQTQVEPRLNSSSFLYPKILEPIREDGINILFVFACGALITPERYLLLLETLRATATQLRLWIAIVTDSSLLTPETLESSLDEALIKAQDLGFQLNGGQVFLGGHSWGGVMAGFVAYKRALGLIHLGSGFFFYNNLIQYPVPVLSVVGSRDGEIGYQTVALNAFRVANVQAEFTEEHTYYYKPVIVIPGMNHAQGFDGENPSFERGDLMAEIPLKQAHNETAVAMTAFLTVTSIGIASKNADIERARSILKAKVRVQREASLTFGKAVDEQGGGAEKMQVQIATEGSSLTRDKVTAIQHIYLSNFNFSRPYEIGGRTIIHVYLQTVQTSYSSLFNMWVKFRSREAILKDFDCTSMEEVDSADGISSARKFNEETFNEALKRISGESRQKYFREGQQLRFVDDLVLDSSEMWDASDVDIQPSRDGAHWYDCQSPVYKTGDVVYMKLITLGRAMNWIYLDAFRLYHIFHV